MLEKISKMLEIGENTGNEGKFIQKLEDLGNKVE